MLLNLICKKNRRRYSQSFYDFAQIIYSQAARSNRIIRQLFPFPSKNRLCNKYSNQISRIKRSLTDMNFCLDLIEKQQITGDCTLAFDAFSFSAFDGTTLGRSHYNAAQIIEKTFPEISHDQQEDDNSTIIQADYKIGDESETENDTEEKEESSELKIIKYSYAFIFLIVPLNYHQPPKIVFILISENGSYKREIDQISEQIRNKLRTINVNSLFQATDGDHGASQIHEDFFNEYFLSNGKIKFPEFSTLLTNVYLNSSKSKKPIPISDPFHLFKCFRGRLLDYGIMLFENSDAIESEIIEEILNLGKPLTDKSELLRMRDNYVLQIFSFSNVIKLIESGQGNAAYIFFIYACIINVILSNKITFSLRMTLLEISYEMIAYLFRHFNAVCKSGATERGGSGSNVLTFLEFHYAKRTINTIVAIGVGL